MLNCYNKTLSVEEKSLDQNSLLCEWHIKGMGACMWPQGQL